MPENAPAGSPDPEAAPSSVLDEAMPAPPEEDDAPFSPIDYVVVNALFLGFLAAVYLLTRGLFHDDGGLRVFFVILAFGFIAVSVYDFLFDRLHRPPPEETHG